MVMKKNAMRRNLRQSILKSFGRYVAIAAIIALGAGLFVGLLMTKTDMVETGQRYMDEQNMFDLRFVSNYGWTEAYVEAFSRLEGVEEAEGLIYLDLIARLSDGKDDAVYRFYSITERMNKVALRGGRMPVADNECLADGYMEGEKILGKKLIVSESNEEDSLESVRYREFTVVGCIASPLYMDMNRGTTSVGSGSLENYFYIPSGAFDVDYFAEINATLTEKYPIYTDAYNDYLDCAVDALEADAEALSEKRFAQVKQEAEEEYADGYREYLDGVAEYEEEKAKALKELDDALLELQDAEKKLADSRQTLINGGLEIENGRKKIKSGRKELEDSQEELTAAKKTAKEAFAAAEAELDAQKAMLKPEYDKAMAAIGQLEAAVDQLEAAIKPKEVKANMESVQKQLSAKQAALSAAKTELEAEKNAENPDAEKIAQLEQTVSDLSSEISALSAQLQSLQEIYAPYAAAVAQLNATKEACQPVIDGMNAINAGYQALKTEKAATEKKFSDAQAQIDKGKKDLDRGERELDDAYDDLMVGWGLYNEGQKELADGWVEYEDGKKEAEQELADAEEELKEAEQELADAREEIDDMDAPDLIILDRNSNVGYNNLDSSSGIVSGVSRVFPVFFLLVASLVCITTMTRMIDEERTQIGTLKALGYSNTAIISKYMFYSGSASLIGCALGVALGSTVFPQVIWHAYCIMLYISPSIVLTVNWPLAIVVTAVYLAVLLFVTWYCCRRTLREEPAELIRPKSPDVGKKILLEYLPFWHKLSFLNKVTIRNIFRYRQRLAMMLIGIGGCTALLVTGFGLRDSIVNVVDFQFEDVMCYDMEVFFRDVPSEKEKREFRSILDGSVENSIFYHQSSVELEFDGRVKEIYMISTDEDVEDFIHMRAGGEKVPLPGLDQVVLTVGVAENLGIEVGDEIVMRNADMQNLKVTVSGIYDNHVENYCLVAPETVEKQWGEPVEKQMAFVRMLEGESAHSLGAELTDENYIMTVSVCEDLANMVKGMMEALDLVVLFIVFCAALLAVIVLYNLTNININERIREIATIKVLGFNARETAAYVFKENLTLTVVGSLLGLVLGKLLLIFVMSQIRIDMVWFKTMITNQTYLVSVALTLISALIVDFVFYFKLDRINMAEALKSVE